MLNYISQRKNHLLPSYIKNQKDGIGELDNFLVPFNLIFRVLFHYLYQSRLASRHTFTEIRLCFSYPAKWYILKLSVDFQIPRFSDYIFLVFILLEILLAMLSLSQKTPCIHGFPLTFLKAPLPLSLAITSSFSILCPALFERPHPSL